VVGDVHALLLEVAYDRDVALTDEDINMHSPCSNAAPSYEVVLWLIGVDVPNTKNT
jgi:hypothetical protein